MKLPNGNGGKRMRSPTLSCRQICCVRTIRRYCDAESERRLYLRRLAAQVGGNRHRALANTSDPVRCSRRTHERAKYAGKDYVNPGSLILRGDDAAPHGLGEAADLIVIPWWRYPSTKSVPMNFARLMNPGPRSVSCSGFRQTHESSA